MTKATLPTPEQSKKHEPIRSMPEPVVEDSDILDWDFSIETPPTHRTGTLRVTLEYVGRGRPMPTVDPRSDG